MNRSVIVTVTAAAALIAAPASADPVPSTDEVVAILAKLTDPGIPAANKGDIVTPGFSPEEAGTVDDHLNQTNAKGLLPYNFVVTEIQPAPANLAGATVTVTGSYHQRSAPESVVLSDQGGRWLITHDTAMTALDNIWHNADHWLINRAGFVPGKANVRT
jgi:hypothetical protein